MALYNSTTSNFEVVDRTNEILVLPQNWTLMNDSGMWNEEFLTTRTVTFEERGGHLFIVKDQVPGAAPQTTGNDLRKLHSYPNIFMPCPFLIFTLPKCSAFYLPHLFIFFQRIECLWFSFAKNKHIFKLLHISIVG